MNAITDTQHAASARSIGAILIDSGRLTPKAVARILEIHKEQGLRFGDAAIQLGLLTEEDIQQALSEQYSYTYLMPGDDSVSEEVVAAFRPFSTIVEQLRALRSQLILRWFDAEPEMHKTLAIVSPESGDGRSFVAANLAVVFSQLGARTLLIDADLRKPRQHELFRLPNKLGLSSVLAGRGELAKVITRIPGLKALSVLPAGAVPPNPQELLTRLPYSSVMIDVQGHFDVVLVDTPAGNETADVHAVTARTRGALIVARKDKTSFPGLQTLHSSLQHSGVAVVGALLNNG